MFGLVAAGIAAVLHMALPSPVGAEDLPAFAYAYGQPAIEPMAAHPGGSETAPPFAVSDAVFFVGGPDMDRFDREGAWIDFWPFSSDAHGLGDPDPYLPYGFPSVSDIDIGPSGDVYALDRYNACIHRYSNDGDFLGGWGGRPGDSPRSFYHPTAVCAGPDASVYVLDAGPGRIKWFSPDGQFLGMWNTPIGQGTLVCTALDIAVGSSGVWLLNATDDYYGPASECRIHRYSPDGQEQASWSIGAVEGQQVEVDSDGNVWVLFTLGGSPRLCRYDASGTLLSEIAIHERTEAFAVSPDFRVHLLVRQVWTGVTASGWFEYVCYRIEVKDFGGTLLETFGDQADMAARGTNAGGWELVVTPEGRSYTWEMFDEWPHGYSAHYDAEGLLIEVIETSHSPVYDPVTDTVVFPPELPGILGPDGDCYSLGHWEYVHPRWTATVSRYSTDGELIDTFTVPGPVGDEHLVESAAGLIFDAEGDLVVALLLVDERTVLWCATVTAAGNLVRSWTLDPGLDAWGISALTVDGGGNVYFALDRSGGCSIEKYSPGGNRIGRIGEWRGSHGWDSYAHAVVDMHIDETGQLRVLDDGANRILVFAYTPGPFPDVPYWHWAKEAVAAAVDAGVVGGYEDGLYHPELAVTRDQMAAYIGRACAGGDENVPQGPAEPTFEDVPTDHWAFDYVEYCAAANIVEGFEADIYAPALTVDRAQMAVYIARSIAEPTGEAGLVDYDPGGAQSFPDVPMDYWAYKHIQFIADAGVVSGYPDGTYKPGGSVTRDQMAVYVARAFALEI
jgi:hypothetical protein